MKKFYIMAAAMLMGLAANAATVNFVRGDQVLESGKTYTYNEYLDLGMYWVYDPDIFILSDEDIVVNVTAECTTGQEIGLCCGGMCVNGKTVTKENIALEAGKKLSANFDYNYDPEDDTVTMVSTDLSITQSGAIGGPLTKITVVFDIKGSSVTLIENDAELNYSAGNLNYNVAGATELALYDANGQQVVGTVVDGCGSLSTANLARGIYVYTLGEKSGKIFVK